MSVSVRVRACVAGRVRGERGDCMGRKVYHCLVFFGRSRPFVQQTRPLVVQQHKCLCLFLSPSPSPSNPCSPPPSTSPLSFFSKMPAHICGPLIHLSSFMSAALVECRHKSRPAPAPSWGKHTTTSNNKSLEPGGSSSHSGATVEPRYTMFS